MYFKSTRELFSWKNVHKLIPEPWVKFHYIRLNIGFQWLDRFFGTNRYLECCKHSKLFTLKFTIGLSSRVLLTIQFWFEALVYHKKWCFLHKPNEGLPNKKKQEKKGCEMMQMLQTLDDFNGGHRLRTVCSLEFRGWCLKVTGSNSVNGSVGPCSE